MALPNNTYREIMDEEAVARPRAKPKTAYVDPTVDLLKKQILGQNLTDKWSGQGKGSPEANAAEMARILASIGITDIKQFGEIPKLKEITPDHVDESGKPVYGETVVQGGGGDSGETWSSFVPYDSSKIVIKDGKAYLNEGTTYGNKLTGQVVPTTYGGNQVGNAWGGTYDGKGNTGYRVQFGPDGTPYFYTTKASSSSWNDVAPALAIAGMAFGVPTWAMGAAMGAGSAYANDGNILEGAIKGGLAGAVVPAIGQEIAAGLSSGLVAAGMDQATANIAGRVLSQTAIADATGRDPTQALITGGLQEAMPTLTGNIEGFSDLNPKTQAALNQALANTLMGNDPTMALTRAAISYANGAPTADTYSTSTPYEPLDDYSFKADYSLAPPAETFSNPDEEWTGQGFKTNAIDDTSYLDTGVADYSLGTTPQPGIGLQMPTTPNMDEMGGGQGLTLPVEGGTMTGNGLISDDYLPPLGDPESFINQPAPGEDVHDAVERAVATPGGGGSRAPSNSGSGGTNTSSQPNTNRQPGLSQGMQAGASDLFPKFMEVKDPWLKIAKPTGQNITLGLQPLQQISDNSDFGNMQFMFADGGSVFEQIDPDLMDILTTRMPYYAGGGDVNPFSSMLDTAKSLSPEFVKQAPTFLRPQGQAKPLQLLALKQMSDKLGKGMAKGGLPSKYEEAAPEGHHPEFITGLTGYYAGGRGTGQSDDIPAMLHDGDYVIDAEAVSALGDGSSKAGKEALTHFLHQVPHQDRQEGNPVPAKIADGEFVLPAAFVTALGGGDNKHGSKLLDEMREKLREHKRAAPLSKIPPKAKSPLEYLSGVKG